MDPATLLRHLLERNYSDEIRAATREQAAAIAARASAARQRDPQLGGTPEQQRAAYGTGRANIAQARKLGFLSGPTYKRGRAVRCRASSRHTARQCRCAAMRTSQAAGFCWTHARRHGRIGSGFQTRNLSRMWSRAQIDKAARKLDRADRRRGTRMTEPEEQLRIHARVAELARANGGLMGLAAAEARRVAAPLIALRPARAMEALLLGWEHVAGHTGAMEQTVYDARGIFRLRPEEEERFVRSAFPGAAVKPR